jgi:hypothetical protein
VTAGDTPSGGAAAQASAPPLPPASRAAAGPRAALGSLRTSSTPAPGLAPTEAPAPQPAAAQPAEPPSAAPPATTPSAPAADLPSRDELTKPWGDSIVVNLPAKVKARFSAGRFLENEEGGAVFALPNAAHRDQCEPIRPDVEQALAAHFGRPVPLRLVAEAASGQAASGGRSPDDDEQGFSRDDLRDAPTVAPSSPADRLKSAFPGSREVDS